MRFRSRFFEIRIGRLQPSNREMGRRTRDEILAFVESCPHSPTVREISQAVNRSPSSVHSQLMKLSIEGRIGREGRRVYVTAKGMEQ